MKKFLSGFLAAIALILLANCTAQTGKTENFKREWMLVEFQDFSKELMVTNKASLNLTNWTTTDPKFTAKMGCNSMFGSAKIVGTGRIKFSDVGSTLMFCDNNMELESAFSKALPTMMNYKIQGHFLTLSDNTGNAMKFVAADWD